LLQRAKGVVTEGLFENGGGSEHGRKYNEESLIFTLHCKNRIHVVARRALPDEAIPR